MGKYASLTRHLLLLNQRTITMTMAEIEAVLGFQLPSSAYVSKSWWGNKPTAHRQAWLEAGYKYAGVQLGSRVQFVSTMKRPRPLLPRQEGFPREVAGRPCYIFFMGTHQPTEEACWIGQFLDGDMEVFVKPAGTGTDTHIRGGNE